MEKPFDFEKIGKRMPYSTPEDFFPQLEERIRREVFPQSSPRPSRRFVFLRQSLGVVAASAAAVGLFFLFHGRPAATPSADFAAIEQAFSNLSAEDQAYLLDIYREDIFYDE